MPAQNSLVKMLTSSEGKSSQKKYKTMLTLSIPSVSKDKTGLLSMILIFLFPHIWSLLR